ncbi:MAG: 4-alpha-glucanotransferase [Sphaerochaeta sp.]|uniref:4-alpha-glucanotransferase n=1 Tax=Sphaerochaeta sp. TaxID=1972642 RepID=UPI003D09F770
MKHNIRRAGVLMHPTSLPSASGIGSLGEEALQFIDLLHQAKIRLWQILPLGPTGYGDSPYAARSTFAGNELLIDLKSLAYDGYLDVQDVLAPPRFSTDRVDYGKVRSYKEPLLGKAADTFLAEAEEQERIDFDRFVAENDWWLDDYALYQVLCSVFHDSRWFSIWPKEIRLREPETMAALHAQYAKQTTRIKVMQYFFFSQWKKVKAYANEMSIQIIGDIPIFVAPDSVDAWANRHLLKMDEDGKQTVSSGVPPDAFSADGQLWGNPVYNWEAHRKQQFAWWIKRIQKTLESCDIIRIDHFRGFAAYWEVPQGEPTAMNGRWVPSPGKELFAALHAQLGEQLPIIAEDLGVITEDVEELRDSNHFPGMKILQFAFNLEQGTLDATNAYLPHNSTYNSVIYTGTHDNNTTKGWFDGLDAASKDIVRRYLECPDDQVVWQMIRQMLLSSSKDAILPMQDWLELGEEGRMNIPSTCNQSNWSWRLESLVLESWRIDRLRSLVELSGRIGL